jgi:uncharacterized OsmC-like protein
MSAQAIRAAMDNVAKAIADNPDKAHSKNGPATASHAGGLKFSIAGLHGEAAVTDMPKAMGGGAEGATPGWYLRAALAACTGSAIAMRAAKLGVDLTGLEVTVESSSDNRGLLGLDDSVSAAISGFRQVVAIKAANATAAELEALVRWADAHSPVGCTLRRALGEEIELVMA